MKDPLLEPFVLGGLTLRNRIVSTSHAPAYQEMGHPRERYRRYHEEKARGGVALTMIGGSTNIAPDSPSVFGQLYAGDDSVIPWFRALTDGVHEQGAAIMCQITHMGRRTAWDNGHWLPVLAPSNVRERAHRSFPKAMEAEDLDRIVDQFAEAARRCVAGGFDGIELLSHAHLLGQFLSPLVNHRDDEYGGSPENRLRFPLRVIEAVREAVGPTVVVGIRMTADELLDGGLDADDGIAIAQALAATKQLDFLNVLVGAPYDDLGLAGWVPPMGLPSAAHLEIAGRIRRESGMPVMHAGGIADLATARHAVSAGHIDLVGMTRAQLADPHLVAKLERGDERRIRPCVGLGYCVDRVNQGKDALCGHNAATGRERTLPHVLQRGTRRKKILVVGGGPGGLEAARVCAERGHRTLLLEASDRLGGQLNLASRGLTRRQISGVVDWLVQEVTLLGVDVRLNHYAEAKDVLREAPDVVVIATGGWPEPIRLPGGHLTLSSWDVLTGEARVAGEILLIDEIGDQPALVCADVMARQGCTVTLATPDRIVAQELGPTNSSVALRDLARLNVCFASYQALASVETDGHRRRATLRHVLTDRLETRTVDHVVVELGASPLDALYHQLKPYARNAGQLDQTALLAGTSPFVDRGVAAGDGHRFELARIGDAVAHRNVHAALLDALRVCKDL